MENTREYSDAVYGTVNLDKKLFSIIDTVEFKRLKNIKQLGNTYHVYSSATHDRFSHCVGTSIITKRWMESLKQNQLELDIQQWHIDVASVAGLIHDIGHGPYSHVFNTWMNAQGKIWEHEIFGMEYFDYLVEKNNVEFDTDVLKAAQKLVLGERINEEYGWMSDLIANHKNGIDSDKFDYICRDSHHISHGVNLQTERIIRNSRVLGNSVCFDEKIVQNVENIFRNRYDLFKTVYTHKGVCAVDAMLKDVLIYSNDEFKFSDWAVDKERFHMLTDDILYLVRSSTKSSRAKNILERIDRRQLYQNVGEFIMADDGKKEKIEKIKEITIENILSFASGSVEFDDVRLEHSWLNYSMKNHDPLKSVRFYSKRNQELTKVDGMVSNLRPNIFQEIVIRVFSVDPNKNKLVKDAVEKFKENKFGI